MAIEIVSFPMKRDDLDHDYVNAYPRVAYIFNQVWSYGAIH